MSLSTHEQLPTTISRGKVFLEHIVADRVLALASGKDRPGIAGTEGIFFEDIVAGDQRLLCGNSEDLLPCRGRKVNHDRRRDGAFGAIACSAFIRQHLALYDQLIACNGRASPEGIEILALKLGHIADDLDVAAPHKRPGSHSRSSSQNAYN